MKKEGVKPVTIEETPKLVGILIYVILVKLPQRRMQCLLSFVKKIASYMRCNRFEENLMIFFLSDNEHQSKPRSSKYDRLYNVRVFLSSLQENFKNQAGPGTRTCVDEQMIPFKGRHSLEVYMTNKPSKRDIKCEGLQEHLVISKTFKYLGMLLFQFLMSLMQLKSRVNSHLNPATSVMLVISQRLSLNEQFFFFDSSNYSLYKDNVIYT